MFNPVKCSRLPVIFAVLCIFGLTCLIASGGEPEILLLTSDGGNHPLSVQLFDKLSALGEVTSLPLDIDGDSTAQKANESLAKFHKTQPLASYDLIVAVDDPAIEALLAEVPDSSQLPPVLIANYRGMPMRFKEKHPNFTGFGGPAYLPQMLDWALKCYPETTRAVIIVDNLPGERDTIPILHAQLNNYQRCDTEIWSGKELSSQTVLEKVRDLPPDSVILLGPWHRAKRDGISSDEKFIQEMAQSSARPIFAVDPYWIGRGALGGYVSGNEIICEDTTALAKRILQGENITKFPVYLMPVECILDGNVFLASRLRFDALPVNPLWINPPFAEHFRWDWYHALAALFAGTLLTLLVMRKLSEPQRSQLAAAKDQINHLASDLLELHRTIDSVPDSLIVTDTTNRIKLVNAAAARMTGYVKEELIGQRIEDFCKLYDRFNHKTVHPKTAEVMKSNRRMIILEHVDLQNRKGDKIHVSELASPIRISGSVAGSVLVLRDLTLDIQQKDQLEVSGKLLSIVGPMCKLSWARLDSEHKLIDTNGTKVTNWPFDANGNHIPAEKWIHPEDLAAFNQIWHDIKNGDKKLLTLNYRALSENGDLRYFAMNICQVVASEFGTIQYLVVIQDITEFGVAERKTRESLQMLQTIIANAPVGIALKDADDEFRYVFWNEAIKKYIDADQNSLAGLTDFDMPYYKEYGQRARIQDEQVMVCGKPLISDEKRIHRDQTESIYHMVKQPVILESGKRYLLAVLVDLTHERHLETQLQQSIQQLQQLLRQEEIYNRSLRQLILTENYESAVQSLVNEIGGSSGAIACFAVGFETDETKSLRCWWHDGQSRLPEQLFEQLAQRTNTDLEQILQNRDATLRLTAQDTGIENVDTTLYPVIDRGKFLGICGLCDVATATPMNRCELLQTFSGLLLVARERTVQNRNLDISQQMRKMIFNNLRVPIMLFDAEGNLLNFNPASLKITGLTEEEIWKKSLLREFLQTIRRVTALSDANDSKNS